jgi:hypothetical protein
VTVSCVALAAVTSAGLSPKLTALSSGLASKPVPVICTVWPGSALGGSSVNSNGAGELERAYQRNPAMPSRAALAPTRIARGTGGFAATRARNCGSGRGAGAWGAAGCGGSAGIGPVAALARIGAPAVAAVAGAALPISSSSSSTAPHCSPGGSASAAAGASGSA